jgi:hypothetical protein
MYNYQHREMPGLLAQLQGEGYDPYCFQSVLINGKGRVHCRPEAVTALNGKAVDSHGCILQPSGAIGYGQCEPSRGQYEIIETENRRWMMMNFVNPGTLPNPSVHKRVLLIQSQVSSIHGEFRLTTTRCGLLLMMAVS